jgi:Response regulator of the LytR/AlgR family
MKLKIAVCDDEPQMANVIGEYVREYFLEECTLDFFYSGHEFLSSDKEYTIVFMDIELEDSNGIDIAEYIKKKNKNTFIIFITNFSGYCKQAISVHAFEYLLKPIKRTELFSILDELKEYLHEKFTIKTVRLKTEKGILQVPINQIIYFEYIERKVRMFLNDEKMFINYTLTQIYNLLIKDDFAMPHRAYIVNLCKIRLIRKFDIFLENGGVIPLAQKKASNFKKHFEIYLYKQV